MCSWTVTVSACIKLATFKRTGKSCPVSSTKNFTVLTVCLNNTSSCIFIYMDWCHSYILNSLHERHQSVHWKMHATEMALMKLGSNITKWVDHCHLSVLVMVWYWTYWEVLTPWAIKCSVNGQLSNPALVSFGLLQGSVLGPKKHNIYSKPHDLICHHEWEYDLHAIGTQISASFNPKEHTSQQEAVSHIEPTDI